MSRPCGRRLWPWWWCVSCLGRLVLVLCLSCALVCARSVWGLRGGVTACPCLTAYPCVLCVPVRSVSSWCPRLSVRSPGVLFIRRVPGVGVFPWQGVVPASSLPTGLPSAYRGTWCLLTEGAWPAPSRTPGWVIGVSFFPFLLRVVLAGWLVGEDVPRRAPIPFPPQRYTHLCITMQTIPPIARVSPVPHVHNYATLVSYLSAA